MSIEQDRAELAQILRSKSVKTGHFVLASGKESDLYVDCRVTTLDARGAVLVGRVLHELLRLEESRRSLAVAALGGLTMGADPISLSVAMTSSLAGDSHPVQAFTVRKEPKGHGRGKRIEGNFTADAPVEGIRMVATRGVQGTLEEALREAGGVKQMNQALSPEQMAALVEKVKTMGDPARGEAVYRRANLLCQTCHAIGDAGGILGPNLVSIGSSAPVDYLIESLLEPSKKIKEGYHMIIVTTKDGKVVSGGLMQDGAEEVVIRDPANQIQKVAKAQIANRQMSPASMMPPGLTASLREDEFVDLVRFMSELGREGHYKVKPNRFVRTWRVLGAMDQEAIDHVRHVGLQALHEKNPAYLWQMAYSTVAGDLPLSEVMTHKMYPWFPKVAQFSLTLASPGKVKLALSATKAVEMVVGAEVMREVTPEMTLELPAGTHPITVVIGRDAGDLDKFRVEVLEGAAQF